MRAPAGPWRWAAPSSARSSPAGLLEPLHLARVHADQARAPRPPRSPARSPGPRCRRARGRRPRRSCAARSASRFSASSTPAAMARCRRILMFTSWSEQSTPAELSMASVLMRPPASAYSTRARWVKPEVAALGRPPGTAARWRRFAPRRWCDRRRRRRSRCDAFTNVPIPPFQRRSTGARRIARDHLVGRERPRRRRRARAAPRARGRPTWRCAGTRRHPARAPPGRSRPTTSRELEQPLPLGEARRGIGIGIDEHVAVVERGDELHVRRPQEAVAEHVARHVADADDREAGGVGVDVQRTEVRLHRDPRAARRDAHLLVVEPRRPTRGERVAEPVAVLGGELVGDVGERAGALVGRDDEVGVVAVVAHDVRAAARPCRRPGCR